MQKQGLSLLANLATLHGPERAFKSAPRLENTVLTAIARHAAAPEVARRGALLVVQLARLPTALARLRSPAHAPPPEPTRAGAVRVPEAGGGAGARVLLRAAAEVARDSPQRRDVVEALFRALAVVAREVRLDGARVNLAKPDDVRAAAAAVDREARLETPMRVILGRGGGKVLTIVE